MSDRLPEISDEMLRKYIIRRQTDIAASRQALTKKDFSVAESLGHQIKGNSQTFGFSEIENIGQRLEEVAKLKDGPQVQSLLDQLQTWADKKIKTLPK